MISAILITPPRQLKHRKLTESPEEGAEQLLLLVLLVILLVARARREAECIDISDEHNSCIVSGLKGNILLQGHDLANS